jgi:hypothetical protein
MCSVVGPKAFIGLTEHDLPTIWRLFGFVYGPILLDRLILLSLGPGWAAPLEALAGAPDEETRDLFKVKLMVGLRAPLDTPAKKVAFLKLYLRMLELERAARAADSRRRVTGQPIDSTLLLVEELSGALAG